MLTLNFSKWIFGDSLCSVAVAIVAGEDRSFALNRHRTITLTPKPGQKSLQLFGCGLVQTNLRFQPAEVLGGLLEIVFVGAIDTETGCSSAVFLLLVPTFLEVLDVLLSQHAWPLFVRFV